MINKIGKGIRETQPVTNETEIDDVEDDIYSVDLLRT